MYRIPRAQLVVATSVALILLVALPLTAAAGPHYYIGRHRLEAASAGKAFTLGRVGGLLPSWTVIIQNNGAVSAQGCVRLTNSQPRLSRDALNGLLKLAEAERFFALPNYLAPKRPVLDTPERFLTISTTSGTKSVTVVGTTKRAFDELFAVVTMAAGAAPGLTCR